eukprot:464942-Pelagomonas_calceolata.AAC.1
MSDSIHVHFIDNAYAKAPVHGCEDNKPKRKAMRTENLPGHSCQGFACAQGFLEAGGKSELLQGAL